MTPKAKVCRAAIAAIEALEGRRMLSVSVGSPAAGVLAISGDSAANNVLVYQNDSGTHQTIVEVLGQGAYVFNEIFDTINADLGKGDDRLRIVFNTDFDGETQTINAGLGQGNDYFSVESAYLQDSLPGVIVPEGGDLVNSTLIVNVEGGQGQDTFDFYLERMSLESSAVTLNTQGANDADVVELILPDFNFGESIENSTLEASLILGNGDDEAEIMGTTDVIASDVILNINGGNGDDDVDLGDDTEGLLALGLINGSSFVANATMGNNEDEFESSLEFGGNGFIIDADSSAAFNVDGGNGADVLHIDLAPGPGGGSSTPIAGDLAFSMYGQRGEDDISLSGGSGTLLQVPAGGTLSALVDAGRENDRAIINLATTGNSNGLYDIDLLGSGENDVLGLRFQNNGTNTAANYVGGSAVLNGGGGTDRWDVDGSVNFGFITVLNAEIEDDAILPGG